MNPDAAPGKPRVGTKPPFSDASTTCRKLFTNRTPDRESSDAAAKHLRFQGPLRQVRLPGPTSGPNPNSSLADMDLTVRPE